MQEMQGGEIYQAWVFNLGGPGIPYLTGGRNPGACPFFEFGGIIHNEGAEHQGCTKSCKSLSSCK